MAPGTKIFKICLDYGQFDIENDVFKFVSSGDDAVCIESLSMDRNDIFLGPKGDKATFWFDSNGKTCTDDFVNTRELIIQNNVVVSSECDP